MAETGSAKASTSAISSEQSWVSLVGSIVSKQSAMIAGGVAAYFTVRKVYDILQRKYNNYPPGPVGMPMIGSLTQSTKNRREFLAELGENYGDVSMYYQLGQPIIVINSSKIMHEYFIKKEFSNRPQRHLFEPKSLMSMNLDDMHFRRKMFVQSLISKTQRSSNLYKYIGKVIKEDTFKAIDECINNNKNNNNNVWKINEDIKYATFSTIFGALFGSEIDRNDSEYKLFNKLQEEMTDNILSYALVQLIIPESSIKDNLLRKTKAMNAREKLLLLIEKWFNESQSLVNQDNNNNNNSGDDYVSRLLEAEKDGKIDRKSMFVDINLGFLAGIGTTSVAIVQAILYLAKYPNIQQSIFNDLKNIMMNEKKESGNNIDCVNDVKCYKKCVHLKAFIHEVLRHHALLDETVERSATKDMKIRNYKLPQNGIIVCNLWGMNHSKNELIKGNGLKFDYNKWITKDGLFDNEKDIYTFGCGPRDCLGKQLGKSEMFLVLGMLIIHYKFCVPNGINVDQFVIPEQMSLGGEGALGVQCQKRTPF